MGPERGLRGVAYFGPQRTDFWLEWADFGLKRANLGPERGLGGGDGQTDRQTYVMVHPCVLQDIGPLEPLPKKRAV